MAWDNQRSGNNVQAQEAEVTKQEFLRLKRELDRTRTHALDRPRVGPMPSAGEGKDGDVRWVIQGRTRARLEKVDGQWVSSTSGAAPVVSPTTGQITGGLTTVTQAVLDYSIVNMNNTGGLAINQILPIGMTFTQFVAALAQAGVFTEPTTVEVARETNRIWFGG